MRAVGAVALTVCFLWLFGQPALAAKRVALVMGNSAYQNTSQLVNPANDSEVMSAMLKGAGFDVVDLKRDLKANEMRRSLRDFADRVRDADVAIVYFAGHGIEIDGANFIIPVDALLERDIDAHDEAISLDRLLTVVAPAKQLRLVILDACRDNPFNKSMKRTIASRAVGRGLAKVEPTSPNTLVAFAAKAGSSAADGDSGNSPFTAALVKYLPRPGLDLRKAFGFTRDEVLKVTNNKQEPFVYGSLGGEDVSLVPAAAPKPPASPVVADPDAAIRRTYELALQVGTIDVWDSFVSNYPNSFYTDLAKAQRRKLAAEEARLAATEKAKATLDERMRLASEGAKVAEQTRAAEQARSAEQARLAAERKKALEEAKVIEAERAKAAAQAKADEERKIAAEKARVAGQARLAAERKKALEEAKVAEAERAKAAAQAKADEERKVAAEKARSAEQARAAELARAAEETQLLAEKNRALEAARLAEAERAKAAAQVKAEEERKVAAEKAKAAEQARLAAEKEVLAAKAAEAEREKVAAQLRATEAARKAAEDAKAEQQVLAAAKQKALDEAEAARIKDLTKATAAEGTKAGDDRAIGQLAALAPSEQIGETIPKSDQSAAAEIPRLLQTELRRVGCNTGALDGNWNAAAQKSLGLFNKHAGTRLDVKVASLDTLDVVRSKAARVCPLICEDGYKVEGDKCTRITCRAGYRVGDDNICERIKSKKPAKREAPAAAARPAAERPAADNSAQTKSAANTEALWAKCSQNGRFGRRTGGFNRVNACVMNGGRL